MWNRSETCLVSTTNIFQQFWNQKHDFFRPFAIFDFLVHSPPARVHQRPGPQNSEWKIADMFRYIIFDSEQIREMWKYSFEALWWLKKIGNTKFLKFVSLLYNNYIIPGYFSGDTEIVENPREKKLRAPNLDGTDIIIIIKKKTGLRSLETP